MPGQGEQKLTKAQRAGLGAVGAALGTAGIGGLAWLHWPLLSPSSACALAGGLGMAMAAVAAKGELPKGKRNTEKPERLLELKALNEKFRLKGELEALRKLQAGRPWPKEVQEALTAADKASAKAEREAAAQSGKELLAGVKSAVASGTSADAIRQRLRPRLFVFDFRPSGEGLAAARPQTVRTQLEMLSNSVTFILAAASEHDEALLRLTSPGGAVATYGLAAAQLQRLRDAGVPLTVCVDTVAASGGYMMACVANSIVSAPFAMVGSIGVIAGVPNIHKVLERNEVEYQQVTAGKYKRTVNVLTPTTEEGLAKFREDVDVIHEAFKEHIRQFRPELDMDSVATGEVWLGSAALGRGLVDQLGTSDEVIRSKVQAGFDAVELSQAKKGKQGLAKFLEGLGGASLSEALEAAVPRLGETARGVWDRLCGQAAQPRVEAPHLHGSDS